MNCELILCNGELSVDFACLRQFTLAALIGTGGDGCVCVCVCVCVCRQFASIENECDLVDH